MTESWASLTPLSSVQRSMWFLDRLAPGSSGYSIALCYEISGPLDIPALSHAIRSFLAAHPVLCTRIVLRDGEPWARTVEPPEPALRIAMPDSPDTDPREAALALAEELAETPFDLVAGPLFRVVLIVAGPDRHLLSITAHHLVFDGGSRQVLERHLAAAYPAGPDLPEPGLPHAELAHAERDWLTGPEAARQLAYWRTRLAGAPTVLRLPTDRPHPDQPAQAGAQLDLPVPEEVIAGLTTLARRHRTSLFVVTLAAYLHFLSVHTGSTDVTVGVPFAGRDRAGRENTVGYLVNTVVLRADLADDPSFDELLRRVRDDVLDAFDHHDIPFPSVVADLAPARHAEHNPLFQHWFDLTVEPADDGVTLAGLHCARRELPIRTTHFDLETHLRRHADGTTLRLVYRTDLFEAATVIRLAERFLAVLADVLAAPGLRLSTHPTVSPTERHALTAQGAEPVPVAPTVTAWLAATIAAHPDRIAVSDADRRLTFRELDQRSARLALALCARGVGPEDVVGVRLPKGVDLVVALTAVLRAGAAYLPIDPALPPMRSAQLTSDAGAVLTITEDAMPVWLDEPEPTSVALPTVLPAGLCYVVHTSGSTGRPKGVAVSHRSLTHLVAWHLDRYALRPGDRVTQIASMSFDAAAWEIWPALLAGAELDLPPAELARAPRDLVAHYARVGTTVAFAPTPLAEYLIREPLRASTRLRVLLTGGDRFRPDPAAAPGVPVVNHYGPTENTVVATAGPPLTAPWPEISIGRPIGAVRCYLLDEHGRLVPPGVPGEVCLGGPGVARGYVGAPGATATAFRPDPFSPEPGGRMYRTGDLARLRPDGELEFLGRIDRQLKVRGHRVEPGEVEAVLLAHPAVTDAAVVAEDDALIAYVVLTEPADVLAHASARLPAYLVPSVVVEVPALALTATGKLDRAALHRPADTVDPADNPRTELEKQVADVWCAVLRRASVGAHADFFALGGHSLAAVRVADEIGESLGLRIPVRTVFDHPTVAGLAAAVESLALAELAALTPEEVAAALAESEQD
ncbi:MAG TPA: amino acid adenylation domain-containing protein [Pseudonocardiaceae bacterium]|nr:amino acid adenylation domain-containing protein [Pseudonocardiaceae bacterium]